MPKLSSLRFRCFGSKGLGDPLAMGSQQIVNEGANLVKIEFRRCVRINHRSIMNEPRIPLEDCFHRKCLNVHVGLHQGGKVGRDATDANRLDPVLVDDTGHLNAAPVGKVFD